MADIALITNTDLVAGTQLGGNIDVTKYQSVILETQNFVIEVILGTKLYQKILADYEAVTLAGDYLELHEKYIKPIIIHSTAAEYISIAGFQIANGGIFRYSPNDAQVASKEEIDFLVNKERSKADVWVQRMQDYLCDKNIPEYDQPQDTNYDVRPDKNISLYGGWRLEGRYYKGTNAEREIWRDILNDEGR